MNAEPGTDAQPSPDASMTAVFPHVKTADSRESAQRVRQAARADNTQEALRQLARDPDVIVRAALAINSACSSDLDTILVNDTDDRVRALLGSRVARLLPNLGSAVQDTAAKHVHGLLAMLAKDQAVRVRAALAEEIKAMDAAPRDLVMLLAQDEAVEVSAPILRLSPALTDDDLLKLLATPPNTSAAGSIAGRTRLSATVADAIVAHADAPTIRTLLANQSACIQEATLDALVGRAPNHTDWHAPLVRRPALSTKSIRALSEFIAIDLLRILASRTDLDPAKLDVLRRRLADKAAQEDEALTLAEAHRLKAGNFLTEAVMLQMAEAADARRLLIFLAVASGVPVRAVERVVELRSAKALVSLVWSSGFSMTFGAVVQTILAQFAPDHVLLATPQGDFPLTKEEMDWQMELMRETAGATSGPTWSVMAAQ